MKVHAIINFMFAVFAIVVALGTYEFDESINGGFLPTELTHSPTRGPEEMTILLRDRGAWEWEAGSGDLGELRPDSITTGEIKLVSKRTIAITDFEVEPSCGCTKAAISSSSLSPGDTSSLTFSFDSSARRGAANIVLLIHGKVPPGTPADAIYRIPLRANVLEDGRSKYLRFSPDVIRFEAVLSSSLKVQKYVEIVPAPGVSSISSVLTESSSAQISAATEQLDGLRPRILVSVTPSVSGLVRGSILVRFKADGKNDTALLQINGVVLPRYTTSPSVINVETSAANVGTVIEIKIRPADIAIAKRPVPKIALDGGWVCSEILPQGDGFLARIFLRSNMLPNQKFSSAEIKIGGERGEAPVIVPIFVTRTDVTR